MTLRPHPADHERPFFHLVLFDYIGIEMPGNKVHEYFIFLEELWQVNVFSSFIRLLVKINGPHPELDIVEVLRDVKNKIVAAHITQQAHEAAFVELDKFLGNSLWIKFRTIHI